MADPPAQQAPAAAPSHADSPRPRSSDSVDPDDSQRKRPRLDSGSGDQIQQLHALHNSDSPKDSAKQAKPPSSSQEVSCATTTEVTTILSLPAEDTAAPQLSPSKEVTINTKSPSLPQEHTAERTKQPFAKSRISLFGSRPKSDDPKASTPEPGQTTTEEVFEIVSIPSSPSSPVIEVADVEDVGQAPSTTTWRPLDHSHFGRKYPTMSELSALWDQFPMGSQLSLSAAMTELSSAFRKGNEIDVNLFLELKTWLEKAALLDIVHFQKFSEIKPDFWPGLPALLDNLLQRNAVFHPDQGRGVISCLTEFFVAYLSVTAGIVQCDHCALDLHLPTMTRRKHNPISPPYLGPIHQLLSSAPISPFMSMLEDTHGASEVGQLRSSVFDSLFNSDPATMTHMSYLLDVSFVVIAEQPNLVLPLVRMTPFVVLCATRALEIQDPNDRLTRSMAIMRTIGCISRIDQIFQASITKSNTYITVEISEQYLLLVTEFWTKMCITESKEALSTILTMKPQIPEGTPSEIGSQIFASQWRVHILTKYIMHGRMELRVHGMETLSTDLLATYKTYIGPEVTDVDHPLVQSLVQALETNKLLEYIVSVQSHPQLVCRGGNIISFLVVTSSFSNEQADLVWNRAFKNKDPRMLIEIIDMLQRAFPMYQTSHGLVHLCSKLRKLPIIRFDLRLVQWTLCLVKAMLGKLRPNSGIAEQAAAHENAVQMCIHLLRQAPSCESMSHDLKRYIRASFDQILLTSLAADKEDGHEETFVTTAMKDLKERSKLASGSLCLVQIISSRFTKAYIERTNETYSWSRLLIETLSQTGGPVLDSEGNIFLDTTMYNTVLQLVMKTLELAPDTVTTELADILFANVFQADGTVTLERRALAWGHLTELVKGSQRNPFVAKVYNIYLNRLKVNDLMPPVIDFIREISLSWIVNGSLPNPQEGQIIKVNTQDLIDTIIYSARSDIVVAQACLLLTHLYLDLDIVTSAPRSAIEATHVSLVDTFIARIEVVAGQLREGVAAAPTASTNDLEDKTANLSLSGYVAHDSLLVFQRSFAFLKTFLAETKARPFYRELMSPRGATIVNNDSDTVVLGTPFELNYQAFGDSPNPIMRKMRVGDLDIAGDLEKRLIRCTGFTKFSMIYKGSRFSLTEKPSATLRDLGLHETHLLIVRKEKGSPAAADRHSSITHVDAALLKHFDKLYELLDLEINYAREIYSFLAHFPIQERVISLVRSPNATCDEVCPREHAYKAIYCTNALQTTLNDEIALPEGSNPDREFLKHALAIVEEALTREGMLQIQLNDFLNTSLILVLLDCANLVTKAYASTASEPVIQNPALWTDVMLHLIDSMILFPTNDPSQIASLALFSLFETARWDSRIWPMIKSRGGMKPQMETVFLQSKNVLLRRCFADNVFAIAGAPSPGRIVWKRDKNLEVKSRVTDLDATLAMELWAGFVETLPKAQDYSSTTFEFFEAALSLMKYLALTSVHAMNFGTLIPQWAEIFLNYTVHEFVGRDVLDPVAYGLISLISSALATTKSANITIDTRALVQKLLEDKLFPDLSAGSLDDEAPLTPILHSGTRQEIYRIMLLSSDGDDAATSDILNILGGLIPTGFAYDADWTVDRAQLIRSPVGYAGIRNLSNTCYLNSLVTQLFMNIEFRQFIINTAITDSKAQKLLVELKKVFAEMQNSWCKDVDPQEFVRSIVTYEGRDVDPTVQMDVEEFYNLLFDRLDSQVEAAERPKLQSFYGGKTVQQIKSTGCAHISEQIQPFSAIQCEIQGKFNLEESLKAYVEGEMLQGANAYHCSKCGKHVEAVKRVCLKEVPDNMIFHLKRFDFDINTLSRSKINDEFRFPERIDMAPYTAEQLANPTVQVKPDIFEITGVLIHSGTAETGHYYSYVKQRALNSVVTGPWIEFNDSEVSYFETSRLPEQCFGGSAEPSNNPQMRYNKVWSAYMLFYKRVVPVEPAPDCLDLYISGDPNPSTVPLPSELSHPIKQTNELFIRSYCLMDPSHSSVVRAFLSRLRTMEFGYQERSRLNRMESRIVPVVLSLFEQIFSRSKYHADVPAIVEDILAIANQSVTFAVRILKWLEINEDAFCNLLFRGIYPLTRQLASRMIMGLLKTIRDQRTNNQGEGTIAVYCQAQYEEKFAWVLDQMEKVFGRLQSFRLMWDDIFATTIRLAELGREETLQLLNRGFLVTGLEVLLLRNDDSLRLRDKHFGYWRLLDRGRKFSHAALLQFLNMMLHHIDFHAGAVPTEVERLPEDVVSCVRDQQRYAPSEAEKHLISAVTHNGEWMLLKSLIESHDCPEAVRDILTTIFNESAEAVEDVPRIVKTLKEGVRLDPASMSIAFLDTSLMFFETTTFGAAIQNVFSHISKGVESIGDEAGLEHFNFIQRFLNIRNEYFEDEPDFFPRLTKEYADFWAPALATYPDSVIRQKALHFTQALLFAPFEDVRLSDDDRERHVRIVNQIMRRSTEKLRLLIKGAEQQNAIIETSQISELNQLMTLGLSVIYDIITDEDRNEISTIMSTAASLAVEIPDDVNSGVWSDSDSDMEDSDVIEEGVTTEAK